MQLKAHHLRSLPVLAAFFGMAACVHASPAVTPVEVWRGGDDGLTVKFADALQTAFGSSSAFALSSGKKAGTLVVNIPSNLQWKEINGRTQVLYTVDFTSVDGRKLGTMKGSCWEDSLSECAAKVTAEARKTKGSD